MFTFIHVVVKGCGNMHLTRYIQRCFCCVPWRARVTQWVRYLDYLTTHTSLSPIQCGFWPGFVNYKKGCTRLAATSDKVYQLLAHGRWFSLDTPASSTTKTGWNIAESGIKHNKSNQICCVMAINLSVESGVTWVIYKVNCKINRLIIVITYMECEWKDECMTFF
jgi:hypothetical protein